MRYIISFWDHTIFNNFFFFSLPLPRVPCHFFSPSLSLSLSLFSLHSFSFSDSLSPFFLLILTESQSSPHLRTLGLLSISCFFSFSSIYHLILSLFLFSFPLPGQNLTLFFLPSLLLSYLYFAEGNPSVVAGGSAILGNQILSKGV